MGQGFGDCMFDRERRELARQGSAVHCGPKLLALLEVLLDAAPRAVTKAKFTTRSGPGPSSPMPTLTSLIAELRTAIGDDAKTPRLVRTIHGYGTRSSGTFRTRDRSEKPPGD